MGIRLYFRDRVTLYIFRLKRKLNSIKIKKILFKSLFYFFLLFLFITSSALYYYTQPNSFIKHAFYLLKFKGLYSEQSSIKAQITKNNELVIDTKNFKLFKQGYIVPIVSLKSAHINISLPKLLKKQIYINKAYFNQPQMQLNLTKDKNLNLGSLNLVDLKAPNQKSFFSFKLDSFKFLNGALRFNFTKNSQIPPINLNKLTARVELSNKAKNGSPIEKEIFLVSNFEWNKKNGLIKLDFSNHDHLWTGTYKFKNININPAVTPKLGDIIPSTFLGGVFNAKGNLKSFSKSEWMSQGTFNVDKASVYNNRFLNGKLYLKGLSGELYGHRFNDNLLLNAKINNIFTPFAIIKGYLNFNLNTNDGEQHFTAVAKANLVKFKRLKPFLKGFIPVAGGDWIQNHIANLRGENFKFIFSADKKIIKPSLQFLPRSITANFTKQEVLDLDLLLTANIKNAIVLPYQGMPLIREGKGKIKLGFESIDINIDSAKVIGGKISNGKIVLGHGIDKATPFHLQAQISAKSEILYPKILPVIPKIAKFAHQIKLNGNVDLDFSLNSSNLLDDSPLFIKLYSKLNNLDLTWKPDNYKSIAITKLKGDLNLTIDKASIDNMSFSKNDLNFILSAKIPYLKPNQQEFNFKLLNFEKLFPTAHNKQLDKSSWLPKKASALINLKRNLDNPPWQWHVETKITDDKNQNLTTAIKFSDHDFSVENITGSLGKIKVRSELKLFDQKTFTADIFSGSSSTTFSFKYSDNHCNIFFSMPDLNWKNLAKWEIPSYRSILIDKEVQSNKEVFCDFNLNIPKFKISTKNVQPFELKGKLKIGKYYEVYIPFYQMGKTKGSLNYVQRGIDDATLTFNVDRLNYNNVLKEVKSLDFTNHLIEPLPNTINNGLVKNKDHAENKILFNLNVDLNIDRLYHSADGHYQLNTNFDYTYDKNHLVNFNTLSLDDNNLSGSVLKTPNYLSVEFNSDLIDLKKWLKMIPKTNNSNKADTIALNNFQNKQLLNESYFKDLPLNSDIKLKINKIIIDKDWNDNLLLNASYQKQASLGQFSVLNIKTFESNYISGNSKIYFLKRPLMAINLAHLDIKLLTNHINGLNFDPFNRDQVKLNTKLKNRDLNFDLLMSGPASVFNIKKHKGFVINGRLEKKAQSLKLNLKKINIGDTNGILELNFGEKQNNLKAKFEVLDFSVVKSILNKIPAKKKKDVNKPIKKPNNVDKSRQNNPVYVDLPDKYWDINVQANNIRFVNSSFSKLNLIFKNTFNKIELVDLSYKKDNKNALTMKGRLLKQEQWKGVFKAKIKDTGDLLDLMNPKIKEQYPIDRGFSTLNSDILLKEVVVDGKTTYKPYTTTSFSANEGLIKKGGSAVFIVSVLSLKSYFNALNNKVSGFEGKGLPFNKIHSKFRSEGGKVVVEEFVFDSPTSRIVGDGLLDYEKDEEDFLVCVQPFGTVDSILGNIPVVEYIFTSKRGALIEFCYKSKGSLKNPSLTPLPLSILPGRFHDLFLFEYKDEKQ